MPSLLKSQLALAIVGAAVFFTNLGVPRLWDEDEPRNAACAREMLERGDWVVPTFNYELRTQKPVLLYWLIMASYQVLGVNEFAARLPSALLAVGTTLVTFHLARRLFSPRVGLLAGIMVATCLMFGVAGRAATPDSCLIFFTTLSLYLYVRSVPQFAPSCATGSASASTDEAYLPRRWLDFVLMYAAMALAVLAKGPVGLLLPIATIGVFVLIIGRSGDSAKKWHARFRDVAMRFARTAWAMRPLTIILVVSVITAPWYVLVAIRTDGEWTRGFFGVENLARFQNAMEGHSGSILYYIPAILIGFFPWSIVLPAAVWFAVRDSFSVSPRSPAYLLLLCWAGVWFGLFSLAGTKLPSYVLPAYPALAIMAAAFVDRWLTEPTCVPRWLMYIAWGTPIVVGIGLVIGLPIAAGRFLPGEELIGLVGLLPLVGGAGALVFYYRDANARAVTTIAIAAVCFSMAMFGGVAVRAGRHHNSNRLIEIAREYSGDGEAALSTFEHPESSVIFYAQNHVTRCTKPAEVLHFFAENEHAYLIANSDRWPELRTQLPADFQVIARQPRFLKEGEVVLVGRTIQTAAVSTSSQR
jgi:4-amino-4-deoxy-L-arabinose transferase-like glycosyltransferase